MRIHGRHGVAYLSVNSGDAASPVAFLSGWDITCTRSVFDITAITDAQHVYGAAVSDVSGSFTGFLDTATAQTYAAAVDGLPRNLYLYPSTTDSGHFFSSLVIADYSIKGGSAAACGLAVTWAAETAVTDTDVDLHVAVAATAAGTARNAAAVVSGGTASAAAVLASGAGTAQGPAVPGTVTSVLASGAGAAQNPTAAITGGTTGYAAVYPAVYGPAGSAGVTTGLASGIGAVRNATASTAASGTASAGLASGAGTALNVSSAQGLAHAVLAAGTGTVRAVAATMVNRFETGSSGVTLTSGAGGNTAGPGVSYLDSVTVGAGGTLAFSSAFAAHGALSAKIATGGTAAGTYMTWSTQLGSPVTSFGRAYVNMSAAPPASDAFIQFQSGAGSWAGAIQLSSGSQLVVQNTAFAFLRTFTTVLAAGAWYRVEWQLAASASNGRIVVSLYAGDSTTALEAYDSGTGQNIGGASTTAVLFGWTGAHAGQPAVYVDDIAFSVTAFPGPAGNGSRVTGLLALASASA